MSINSRDIVDFAYELLRGKTELREIEARTIMGRAYYGAHHAAKQNAKIEDTSENVHRAVIEFYRDKNNLVFNKLGTLFKDRKKADYDIHINIAANSSANLREAKVSCTKALSILKELEVAEG